MFKFTLINDFIFNTLIYVNNRKKMHFNLHKKVLFEELFKMTFYCKHLEQKSDERHGCQLLKFGTKMFQCKQKCNLTPEIGCAI